MVDQLSHYNQLENIMKELTNIATFCQELYKQYMIITDKLDILLAAQTEHQEEPKDTFTEELVQSQQNGNKLETVRESQIDHSDHVSQINALRDAEKERILEREQLKISGFSRKLTQLDSQVNGLLFGNNTISGTTINKETSNTWSIALSTNLNGDQPEQPDDDDDLMICINCMMTGHWHMDIGNCPLPFAMKQIKENLNRFKDPSASNRVTLPFLPPDFVLNQTGRDLSHVICINCMQTGHWHWTCPHPFDQKKQHKNMGKFADPRARNRLTLPFTPFDISR